MLSEAGLKYLTEALAKVVPDGHILNVLSVLPKVGFADSDVQPVIGFVLGRAEDCARFTQIVDRGISEYQEEMGLSAALFRERLEKSAADV